MVYTASASCGEPRCSSNALKLRPDLADRRREWLQRNDAEAGKLYGILPLAIGMPVALTRLAPDIFIQVLNHLIYIIIVLKLFFY